jgi:hypothetical protein
MLQLHPASLSLSPSTTVLIPGTLVEPKSAPASRATHLLYHGGGGVNAHSNNGYNGGGYTSNGNSSGNNNNNNNGGIRHPQQQQHMHVPKSKSAAPGSSSVSLFGAFGSLTGSASSTATSTATMATTMSSSTSSSSGGGGAAGKRRLSSTGYVNVGTGKRHSLVQSQQQQQQQQLAAQSFVASLNTLHDVPPLQPDVGAAATNEPMSLPQWPRPPPNPRDHSLLEMIYMEMHASRFINLAPVSLLSSLLVLHFRGGFFRSLSITSFFVDPACRRAKSPAVADHVPSIEQTIPTLETAPETQARVHP